MKVFSSLSTTSTEKITDLSNSWRAHEVHATQ